jgi:hypothetical protein
MIPQILSAGAALLAQPRGPRLQAIALGVEVLRQVREVLREHPALAAPSPVPRRARRSSCTRRLLVGAATAIPAMSARAGALTT